MSNFNFSPEFSTDVRAEFDRRSGFMQSKDSEWNYRKYAYFYIESLPSSVDLSSTDSNYLSVFSLLPEGGLRIGTNPPDGYLKSFHSNEDDIRTLKPVLSSATISAQGGGVQMGCWESVGERVFVALGGNVNVLGNVTTGVSVCVGNKEQAVSINPTIKRRVYAVKRGK